MLLSQNNIDVISKYIEITYDRDKKDDYTIELKRYERTALHESVEENDIEIVKLLLTKNDIDVNCFAHLKNDIIYIERAQNHDLEVFEYNKTPLYMAVDTECVEIVELLLSINKIDPNILSLDSYVIDDENDEKTYYYVNVIIQLFI